jgi:hypothetical protein
MKKSGDVIVCLGALLLLFVCFYWFFSSRRVERESAERIQSIQSGESGESGESQGLQTTLSSKFKVPLYFHIVNESPFPSNFQTQTLPELKKIYNPTCIEFVCLQTDQVSIPQTLLTLLLEERKSKDFEDQIHSLFDSYPVNSIHVFLIESITPTTHGRAYPKQIPFCFVSLENSGISLSRTIAHEISHLFGNHHPSKSVSHIEGDLLMTAGHGGTRLTPEESQQIQTVAEQRYRTDGFVCS